MTSHGVDLDILGSGFKIRTSSRRWATFLSDLWDGFVVDDAPAGARDIQVQEGDEEHFLGLPGHDRSRLVDAWQLAEVLRYWMVEEAVGAADDIVALHAASVVGPMGGVMLVGGSGAGKTTLALALVEGGWALGGDDIAPLEKDTGLVRPFPKPLSVKRTAATIDQRWLDRDTWPPYGGGALLVPAKALPRAIEPFIPHRLFFVEFDPAQESCIEPVPPAEAVTALIPFVRAIDAEVVEVLARLTRAARSARLRYANTKEGVELVASSGGDSRQAHPKIG